MKQTKFPDRVHEFREKLGLTQTALAEAADINPTAFSRLLAGDREWRAEHIVSLARALGTSPLDLVANTSAEVILSRGWIDPDTFSRSERERLIAVQELGALRAEVDILRDRVASADALRADATRLHAANERLRNDLGHWKTAAESAGKDRDLLQTRVDVLVPQWEECKARCADLVQMVNSAHRQLGQVRAEAERTKAGAGLVTGLGLLAAVLIADGGGGRGR